MKSFTLLFIGFFVSSIGFTQSKTKLDAYLQTLAKKNKAYVSVAIYKDGVQQYANANGFAYMGKKDKSIANTPNTIFRIGSVSKMFTAIMIMQLAEEGKLQLSDQLSRYFPTIANANNITIDQMLQHKSGLFDITRDDSFFTKAEKEMNQADMIAYIARHDTIFAAGAKSKYCNSNFILLSYIIEQIEKQPYAQLLQNRICKKIGLSNTKVFSQLREENDAASFEREDDLWMNAMNTHPTIPMGAGNIKSTSADLSKMLHSLFTNQLLNQQSLAMMMNAPEKMGRGMFKINCIDEDGFGHNGSIDGFRSMIVYMPKSKYSIVLLCNALNDVELNDLIMPLLKDIKQQAWEVPTFKKVVAPKVDVSETTLKKYIGLYKASNFPLDISITKKGGELFGQATGQGDFPLKAISETEFVFESAGIQLQFVPNAANEFTKMKFVQGANKVEFTKQ
jgi:D-alanyl-D-alanine carboxypeptidase